MNLILLVLSATIYDQHALTNANPRFKPQGMISVSVGWPNVPERLFGDHFIVQGEIEALVTREELGPLQRVTVSPLSLTFPFQGGFTTGNELFTLTMEVDDTLRIERTESIYENLGGFITRTGEFSGLDPLQLHWTVQGQSSSVSGDAVLDQRIGYTDVQRFLMGENQAVVPYLGLYYAAPTIRVEVDSLPLDIYPHVLIDYALIPEPSGIVLLIVGTLLIGLLARRGANSWFNQR